MSFRLTALLTGATDGIGKAAALRLSAEGIFKKLVIAGRNAEKTAAVADECRKIVAALPEQKAKTDIAVVLGDFSSLDSVNAMADEVTSIAPDLSCIINNAGVLTNDFAQTKDGLEMMFGVNGVAPLTLSLRLMPLLEKNGLVAGAPQSRLIFVSSLAHLWVGCGMMQKDPITGVLARSGKLIEAMPDEAKMNPTAENFGWYFAYGFSKLCNTSNAAEIQRRLAVKYANQRQPVVVGSCHPGVIDTKLLSDLTKASGVKGNPVETGIRSILHLSTSQELINHSGEYWHEDGTLADRNSITKKPEENLKLWRAMCKCAGPRIDEKYNTENGL